MFKRLCAVSLIAALSGCAAMGGHLANAGATICANRALVEPSLVIAREQARMIPDPVTRAAVIASYDISLAAFEKCPPSAAGGV